MSDEAVTVHFLRKDGSTADEVIEPGADGGYTWAVPADCDGITGWTLADGTRADVGTAGGGAAASAGLVVKPGETVSYG